jgi:hypothetical protein
MEITTAAYGVDISFGWISVEETRDRKKGRKEDRELGEKSTRSISMQDGTDPSPRPPRRKWPRGF